jgi:hypothetical protein
MTTAHDTAAAAVVCLVNVEMVAPARRLPVAGEKITTIGEESAAGALCAPRRALTDAAAVDDDDEMAKVINGRRRLTGSGALSTFHFSHRAARQRPPPALQRPKVIRPIAASYRSIDRRRRRTAHASATRASWTHFLSFGHKNRGECSARVSRRPGACLLSTRALSDGGGRHHLLMQPGGRTGSVRYRARLSNVIARAERSANFA